MATFKEVEEQAERNMYAEASRDYPEEGPCLPCANRGCEYYNIYDRIHCNRYGKWSADVLCGRYRPRDPEDQKLIDIEPHIKELQKIAVKIQDLVISLRELL